MQILKIKLSQDEQDAIFNELTLQFTTEDTKQTISFDWFMSYITLDVESTLELYTEYPEPDENNQTAISSRSVVKFSITFFHDGEEVEVVMNEKCGECMSDRIEKYYSI